MTVRPNVLAPADVYRRADGFYRIGSAKSTSGGAWIWVPPVFHTDIEADDKQLGACLRAALLRPHPIVDALA